MLGNINGVVPQIDHDHSAPETYNDNLSHHASSFGHPVHGHHNKEPVLYLPVIFLTSKN